jgi:hypothetical protein
MSNSRRISDMDARRMLSKVQWKSGVEVFEAKERGERVLLVRLGETAVILTPENIGGFVERVDSESKAIDLATFFQRGVLFVKESDARAFIQACRDHKVGKLNKEDGAQLTTGCSLDAGKSTYHVLLVSYRDRNLVVANYAISSNGHIDYQCEDLVEGPPVVAGWDAPDERFRSYVQRSEQFKKTIEPIVGKAAVTLLQEVKANEQGMLRAREHALEWLLAKRMRVRTYTQAIQKALEDPSMSPALKQKAMSELELCSTPE